MPIDFYYTPASFNCRAVQLTAKAIGVDLNLKITHTGNKDHLKPEFIQVNIYHLLSYHCVQFIFSFSFTFAIVKSSTLSTNNQR